MQIMTQNLDLGDAPNPAATEITNNQESSVTLQSGAEEVAAQEIAMFTDAPTSESAKPQFERLVRGSEMSLEPFEPDELPRLPQSPTAESDLSQSATFTLQQVQQIQSVVAPAPMTLEQRSEVEPESSGARYDEESRHQQGGSEDQEADAESQEELTPAELLKKVRNLNLTDI